MAPTMRQVMRRVMQVRARRGLALLLDRFVPQRIADLDVASLDMAHGLRCVLGQMYGDFIIGAQALFGEDVLVDDNWRRTVAAGFAVDLDVGEEYDDLTAAWRQVLAEWTANPD